MSAAISGSATGMIRGAYDVVGTGKLPEPIGDIFVIGTDKGEWHMLTGDGYYLSRLFEADPLKIRWPDPATEDPVAGNGYVSEDRVIRLVEAAGFQFEARSDHNRNPEDTRDHPNGVWTLLPGLDIDDAQKEKFRAIGESDRMVLRFRKPAG